MLLSGFRIQDSGLGWEGLSACCAPGGGVQVAPDGRVCAGGNVSTLRKVLTLRKVKCVDFEKGVNLEKGVNFDNFPR